MYSQGKAVTARRTLVRLLAEPSTIDVALRLSAMQALLEICIHSRADDCVVEYGQKYAVEAKAAPAANDVQVRENALRAAYYYDRARFAMGTPEVTAKILDSVVWKQDTSLYVDLYIQRRMLASEVLLALDKQVEADRSVDRTLSLIASLKNPQDDRFTVACALAQAIAILIELGEADRAHGIYMASGDFIRRALPPLSVDMLVYRVTEARLLQETGDLKSSVVALDAAIDLAGRIELDDEVQAGALSTALTLKAVACVGLGRLDCAQAALRQNPVAALYAARGRSPASTDEVAYLAVRALVGALGQADDPVAAQALKRPLGFHVDPRTDAQLEMWRLAGAALAVPPGPERQDGLFEVGRRAKDALGLEPARAFGAWYRPGAMDRLLIGLALTQAGAQKPDAAEVAFAMLQLVGRQGVSVDADALTALGQAKDEVQRHSIHQALRLRARRDRFEREELQAMAARALSTPRAPAFLTYDALPRSYFRDFSDRIAAAARDLARDGVSTSGANVVPLARFQGVLGDHEAALSLTPVFGGVAYMCVRRGEVLRKVTPADLRQAALDSRIVGAALTAGHAPSEALDAQFPVAAAVRLYDVLIRPFEGCLRPGDQILWLPHASLTPVPLSVLLRHAPPKAGEGYDLGAARWLVRDHSIAYAGSASSIVAARSGPRRADADFDFLGIGDPILTGVTPGGEHRARILTRGVGVATLAALAPLPETKAELEESARRFKTTRVLTQAQATERGVRGELVGAYRFLSFATHGLLRDDLQGLSEPALALTPVSSTESSNDGLLTASEIADLNLSARFVALSACNTANFDLSQMSAALPALATAFAVAGVPATLATLWPVESETSKRVTAATFARLRDDPGAGAARALAAAQRAFLAVPPGRAYLHPRFWAPFILLGDGGGPPQTAPGVRVTSTETLTQGGGGVRAVRRSRGGLLSQFLTDPDPSGRHRVATRATGLGGKQAWSHRAKEGVVVRLLAELGPLVVIGGSEADAAEGVVPELEAIDRASGDPVRAWRGVARPGLSQVVLTGVASGDKAWMVVNTINRDGSPAAGPPLQVFEFEPDLAPRLLFDAGPPGAAIHAATITPVGDALLLTYTGVQNKPPAARSPLGDDFDQPLCSREPITRIELRDGRSGELRVSKDVRGLTVAVALERNGKAWLGGALTKACTEDPKAVIVAVDATLEARVLHEDASVGASEVKAMGATPDGGAFVVASKQEVVDFRPRQIDAASGLADIQNDLQVKFNGMVFSVRPDGGAAAPRIIEGGSHVFFQAVDASVPGEVLVGGAVGGEAVVLRLDARRRSAALDSRTP